MKKTAKNKESKPKVDDVVLVHGKTDDGEGMKVLRKKGEELSSGEIRPIREGQPLDGEMVSLSPREQQGLFDVEVHYSPENPTSTNLSANPTSPTSFSKLERPAKVSNPEFRQGWDLIWGGRKRRSKKLLN